MLNPTSIYLSAYLGQAAVNALLAAVLLGLWRRYRHAFLQRWSLSWGAFALFHLGTAGALWKSVDDPTGAFRTFASLMAQVGCFVGAGLLACGTYELGTKRSVSNRRLAWLLGISVVAAAVVVLGTVDSLPRDRAATRVGVRALVVAIAFLGSVWAVWQTDPERRSWGRRLVAVFFGFYGLEQLHYATLSLMPGLEFVSILYTLHFLDVDLILQACVGIGMVIWFFEEERTRAERATSALIESRESLRQSQRLEAIGRLAGGVAHDFNNLLSVVFSYLELLEDEVGDRPTAQDSIEQIRAAADRAEGLTSQLLAFGRRQRLDPVVVSLNRVVRDVDRMVLKAVGEDVQLEIDLDPRNPHVLIDRAQLDLSILNIALNARDAMAGGGSLRIATGIERVDGGDLDPGDYAVLAISDSGQGMDEEVRSRIFQPFFTTKEPGRGTGLGLSMVYGVVRQSGGDVRVESIPGSGTTFRIVLPVVDADSESEPPRQRPGRREGHGERVLLVEDTGPIRILAKRVLSEAGYEVRAAESGHSAMAVIDAGFEPELLLTDVVMPGMNGRELADQVAARLPGTKTLYTSGYPDDVLSARGLSRPGVRFLPKPFSPSRLLAAVRDAIDARGSETESVDPRSNGPSA